MEFCKAIKISQSALSKIERGNMKPNLKAFLAAYKDKLAQKFTVLMFSKDENVVKAAKDIWEVLYNEKK